MTWSEKVMLHISRSVSSAWTHLWCFHRSSWSLSKVIAEKLLVTFHDLKWPWRHGNGSLVAIFRLSVPSLPVTRCLRVFRMVFFQKRRLSFFSHWLIMEGPQNWPDFWSLISKFRDIHLIDIGTDINCSKIHDDWTFFCSYDEHSNFFWREVTWRVGLKFSQLVRKKTCEQVYQKRRRSAPLFLRYLRKTWKRCSNTPFPLTPGPAQVNTITGGLSWVR